MGRSEFGQYHHSGYNFTFGYLEILNEIDLRPHIWFSNDPVANTRRYISLYDGVASVVRKNHPTIKFVGNCLAGRGDQDNGVVWRTFLNQSEHRPGTPWPPEAVSWHMYAVMAHGKPWSEWPSYLVAQARGYLPACEFVSKLIKQLSPTTMIFADEIGICNSCGGPIAEMNAPSLLGMGGNTSWWNLHSAIYAMWHGELSAAGVDMLGASQFVGYPSAAYSGNGIQPFEGDADATGNCFDMTMVDWTTGAGNARWWTLKMLNDAMGFELKHPLPSTVQLTTDVYARGFRPAGGTRFPGPTNHTIVIASLVNTTRQVFVPDAKGGAPIWMVAHRQAGYDYVPYSMGSTDPSGSIAIPPFAVAVVFVLPGRCPSGQPLQ